MDAASTAKRRCVRPPLLRAPPCWRHLTCATSAWAAAENALGVDAHDLEAAVARLKGRRLLTTHLLERPLTLGTLLAVKTTNASDGTELAGVHAMPAEFRARGAHLRPQLTQ